MCFLILFISVVLIKFALNCYNFLRTKQLQKYFDEFIHEKRTDMNLYRQEVIGLFKKAGVKDVHTPVTEPAGYGRIISVTASVFSMFPSLRPAFVATALNMFEEAEGVFRKNMFDCINPLYWIELVIFFPKNVLDYLGLDLEKTSTKLCNLLLTFIWWISGILIFFFKPQIQQFIIKLVGKL